MDEFEQGGIDPQMKRFFKNIVSSFSFGALWMLLMSTAGLYFGLALIQDRLQWYNVLFYVVFVASLFWLLRFLYRIWTKE